MPQYKVKLPIALSGRVEPGSIVTLTAEEAANIGEESLELVEGTEGEQTEGAKTEGEAGADEAAKTEGEGEGEKTQAEGTEGEQTA